MADEEVPDEITLEKSNLDVREPLSKEHLKDEETDEYLTEDAEKTGARDKGKDTPNSERAHSLQKDLSFVVTPKDAASEISEESRKASRKSDYDPEHDVPEIIVTEDVSEPEKEVLPEQDGGNDQIELESVQAEGSASNLQSERKGSTSRRKSSTQERKRNSLLLQDVLHMKESLSNTRDLEGSGSSIKAEGSSWHRASVIAAKRRSSQHAKLVVSSLKITGMSLTNIPPPGGLHKSMTGIQVISFRKQTDDNIPQFTEQEDLQDVDQQVEAGPKVAVFDREDLIRKYKCCRQKMPAQQYHRTYRVADTSKDLPLTQCFTEEQYNELLGKRIMTGNFKEALARKEFLEHTNMLTQNKLAAHLKKKKATDPRDSIKGYNEEKYIRILNELLRLRRFDAENRIRYEALLEQIKERYQEKEEQVVAQRSNLMQFKRHVVQSARFIQNRKPIPIAVIDRCLADSLDKEHEISKIRLENIKLTNRMMTEQNTLKSKEKLADGLHIKDFEQYRIENQTYNEKIEEKNEELLRLKKKINSSAQIISHLKEKVQFFQVDNNKRHEALRELDASVSRSRDLLTRTKHARDSIRIDNNSLRNDCGLLGNTPLLKDYERLKEERKELQEKIDQMKAKHDMLIARTNRVRGLIEVANLTIARRTWEFY